MRCSFPNLYTYLMWSNLGCCNIVAYIFYKKFMPIPRWTTESICQSPCFVANHKSKIYKSIIVCWRFVDSFIDFSKAGNCVAQSKLTLDILELFSILNFILVGWGSEEVDRNIQPIKRIFSSNLHVTFLIITIWRSKLLKAAGIPLLSVAKLNLQVTYCSKETCFGLGCSTRQS